MVFTVRVNLTDTHVVNRGAKKEDMESMGITCTSELPVKCSQMHNSFFYWFSFFIPPFLCHTRDRDWCKTQSHFHPLPLPWSLAKTGLKHLFGLRLTCVIDKLVLLQPHFLPPLNFVSLMLSLSFSLLRLLSTAFSV